jgi:antitoxin VapB
MSAQLNIKSDDAWRLASELASLTGESLTAAVTRVLREAVEQERRKRDVDAEVARMLAAGAEIRAHMREPVSSDHDFLYDPETGLPV